MRLILQNYGFDIFADQDDKYEMVISASKGELRFDEIKQWIEMRLRKKNEA